MDDQWLLDGVSHAHERIQRLERFLEHDRHVPSRRLQSLAVELLQVHSIDDDGALVGLEEPERQPPDSGLARTALADQSQCLARLDVQVDAVDGVDPLAAPPERLAHPAEGDEGHHRLPAEEPGGRGLASCAASLS